jgi:uncharacterized protein with PIN domain
MSNSLADQMIRRQQERARAAAEKMVCPKCESRMVDVGALTVQIEDDSPMNGNYCCKCYRDWVGANFPKFITDEEHALSKLQVGKK